MSHLFFIPLRIPRWLQLDSTESLNTGTDKMTDLLLVLHFTIAVFILRFIGKHNMYYFTLAISEGRDRKVV